MKPEVSNVFLDVDKALTIAQQCTGLNVTRRDIELLLKLGLLPNFGSTLEPLILEEHARLLTGRVGTEVEVAFASLRAAVAPTSLELDGHELVQLTSNIALSFDPDQVSIPAIQAFVRSIRSPLAPVMPKGEWNRTLTILERGPCVWASENLNPDWLVAQWKIALSKEAKTSVAESLCVPMLYGSKGRVSSFVVSTVRQNLEEGSPLCDLMTGTGLVTRHLLPYYPVHANDAALFAARVAASHGLDISQTSAQALLRSMRPHFDENFRAIRELFEPALVVEEGFLLGGLSSGRLANYRDFTSVCTRFVPEFQPQLQPTIWPLTADGPLRGRVEEQVRRGKRSPRDSPYVMTIAYWGNCYFGMRQAAEIDSLLFAVERGVKPEDRPIVEAVLLAAADACASGPHYAQPPKGKTDSQIKQLIEKRAKSVFGEFELRLSLACKRPQMCRRQLLTTNLQWRDALQQFAKMYNGYSSKGVYVDPPYSRLQYSRYYHVFDTLLRYDYPACQGEGRTSEREKRFSSAFDCRVQTAAEEFHALFRAVAEAEATLFLSCATGGTVTLEKILTLTCQQFKKVQVYTVPLQHHSQGVALQNRGHRLEAVIVAKK